MRKDKEEEEEEGEVLGNTQVDSYLLRGEQELLEGGGKSRERRRNKNMKSGEKKIRKEEKTSWGWSCAKLSLATS